MKMELFIKRMVADCRDISLRMMDSEILRQLQGQEKIRVVRDLFDARKRRINRIDRLLVRLDTFKTPVGHRTKLSFLINNLFDRIGKIG